MIALWLAVAQAADTNLSLADAITEVEAANPDLASTELRELLSRIDVQRAKLDRFGASVTANGSAELGVVKPWGAEAYDASGANWDARGTGSMILWSGGGVDANIDRAEASLDVTRTDIEITRRQLVRSAIDAYWNVKGIELSIAATEDALDATAETLAIIEARAAAGLSADLDVNRSRVDLVSQQADLLSQRQRQYAAEQDLLQLLGHDASDHLVLTDAVSTEPELAPVSVSEGDGDARPELARVEASIDQNDAELRLARSGALPAVSVVGTAGAAGATAGTSLGGPDADQLRPTLDASIGLRATWSPFDLWKTRQNVERAKVGARQLEQQQRSQELEIGNQVRVAASRVNMLREQVPLVRSQQELAASNLRIVQELYGQGNASILDLFSAQSAFRSARLREADLLVQLTLAEVALRWARGDDLTETAP